MARPYRYPSPLLPLNAYHAILLTAIGYLARSLAADCAQGQAAQDRNDLKKCASLLDAARIHLDCFENLVRRKIPAEWLALPAWKQAFRFEKLEEYRAYQQMRSEASADCLRFTVATLEAPQYCLPLAFKDEGFQTLYTLRQLARSAEQAPNLDQRMQHIVDGIDAAATYLTLFSRLLEDYERRTNAR